MGIKQSNQTLNATEIDCGGTVKVALTLAASPDISENPVDIVLVLDRSGSMRGTPLANLQAGAKKYIDRIDAATGSAENGVIGDGCRIGIVSFSDLATQDTQLITSVDTLKAAVNALDADGLTNHADAFAKAADLFDPASTNDKIILLLTDGRSTTGLPCSPVAAAARADGIEIYCIGLQGNDGADEAALLDWATGSDQSHVTVTDDDARLEELFAELATNITRPGATNLVVDETMDADFVIERILPPAMGTASLIDSSTLQWRIDRLGVTANESAALEFIARHVGTTPGDRTVTGTARYSDAQSNTASFPTPTVHVGCGLVVFPEECHKPVSVTIGGCKDAVVFHAGDLCMGSLGRILQVTLQIKNVCPHRRVALAVLVNELDAKQNKYPRGMKIVTVPAHQAPCCRDVLVKCISFVLPEDLDVSGGSPHEICNPRSFEVRTIAHYIDTDPICCHP